MMRHDLVTRISRGIATGAWALLFVAILVILLSPAWLRRDRSHGSLRRVFGQIRTSVTLTRVNVGLALYELGQQSAVLKAEIADASEKVHELEAVVVFTDCLERRSGSSVRLAFELGEFNEVCLQEIVTKTSEQISASAAEIIARKKRR